MNSIMNEIRSIIADKKGLIMAGAALTLVLSVYFIAWHWSILACGSIYSVRDISGGFLRLAAAYLTVSALISSVICGLLIVVRRPAARKFIAGAALFLFFGSEFVRMFDWGALYFGGNHVDTNFWAHAFYADGTVYLTTWLSLGIYVTVILLFALMFFIIRRIYRYTVYPEAGGLS
jgi:hypothetical protein